MDELTALPNAWDTPVEVMLSRYLKTGDMTDAPPEARAQLEAVLRAEPIARGCPSLAMLTPVDLLATRAYLEMHGADADVALAALECFLSWARDAGAHALPAAVVAAALRSPTE